jgi:hypothetical protein
MGSRNLVGIPPDGRPTALTPRWEFGQPDAVRGEKVGPTVGVRYYMYASALRTTHEAYLTLRCWRVRPERLGHHCLITTYMTSGDAVSPSMW